MFGFSTFGRVYGATICISGVANFAQYGLDKLTHGPLHDDPTVINAVMTVSGFVVGLTLVLYVRFKSEGVRRKQLEEDAEYERERLIPAVMRIEEEDEEA